MIKNAGAFTLIYNFIYMVAYYNESTVVGKQSFVSYILKTKNLMNYYFM